MRSVTHHSELRSYFDYSSVGVEVLQDGLQPISFGEYLVERGVITRFQLFRALQLQDRHPGVRVGECLAALGFLPYREVEQHLGTWNRVHVVEA